MSRLKEKYQNEVRFKLQEEFGIKNILAVPKLVKIALNVGVGEAKTNPAVAEKVATNLVAITGQKVLITRAKGSISGFSLSAGQPVGVMVTLRGERMYDFLDKLISVVLPKVRDFRGLSKTSFDEQGNFTLGLREQIIFPEVDFKNIDKMRGLEISVVTTAKDQEKGKRLLELLGLPLKKNYG